MKKNWSPAKTCKHPKVNQYFSEDGLLEWCATCGALVEDHHLRKFGKPHPSN